MHDIFDGCDAALIDAARAAFEADAGPYGFDLKRNKCAAPEPWSEYSDADTGHRWAGWLAACSAIVPAGWQVVPREPTDEMVAAGWDVEELRTPDRIYRAMLNTAPKTPNA